MDVQEGYDKAYDTSMPFFDASVKKASSFESFMQ